MNVSDKIDPTIKVSEDFSNHLNKLFERASTIAKNFSNPNSSNVGLFIAHFIWIERHTEKSTLKDFSEMSMIENEVRRRLNNKWDKRNWKRYLLRAVFGFKNGNSKSEQKIINIYLMLIEYIKSKEIELKRIENYFEKNTYKGVVKLASKEKEAKNSKRKSRMKSSKRSTVKKSKTTKKSAQNSSNKVKRTPKKSKKVNRTPNGSKKVKKTKKNSKGVVRSPKKSVITRKTMKKVTTTTTITSKKVVKKIK